MFFLETKTHFLLASSQLENKINIVSEITVMKSSVHFTLEANNCLSEIALCAYNRNKL